MVERREVGGRGLVGLLAQRRRRVGAAPGRLGAERPRAEGDDGRRGDDRAEGPGPPEATAGRHRGHGHASVEDLGQVSSTL